MDSGDQEVFETDVAAPSGSKSPEPVIPETKATIPSEQDVRSPTSVPRDGLGLHFMFVLLSFDGLVTYKKGSLKYCP